MHFSDLLNVIIQGKFSAERHFIRDRIYDKGIIAERTATPPKAKAKETVTVKNICNFSHDSIDKAERKPGPERGWLDYERRDYFRLGCSLKGS